jgi:MSHA pilin protein MshD
MSSSRQLRQRGLTLIEMIMFIMIVGIALAAVLGVLNLTTKGSADPLRQKQALMLAEGLLEEVQLARFSYCDPTSDNAGEADNSAACDVPENWGPEDGGKRPHDNINDYVTAPAVLQRSFDSGGELVDANGEAMGVEGFTATVSVTPAALNDIAAGGNSADVNVLRIRVEVAYEGGTVVLDGFRTRYAPEFL